MRVDEVLRPLVLEADAQRVGSAVSAWLNVGLTVRVVRGRKMRTRTGVFDEFAAALQFPLYFGENEDAFDEGLSELEHLPQGDGYVVVITEPDQVLADEQGMAFEWLVRALSRASKEWSQPIELGEWWDRAAVPFHVVLAGSPDAVTLAAKRWTMLGIEILPFTESHN